VKEKRGVRIEDVSGSDRGQARTFHLRNSHPLLLPYTGPHILIRSEVRDMWNMTQIYELDSHDLVAGQF
jgi:hypothetical protein